MQIVNMHEAKTHLSRLVEKAVRGEPFVIAKAGKPLVTVAAIVEGKKSGKREFGFLKGKGTIPDDFKAFARDEIDEMFFGNPDKLEL